jgi:hypothetical protein
MDYGTLVILRQKHPAWRLLVANHAPFDHQFPVRDLHSSESPDGFRARDSDSTG